MIASKSKTTRQRQRVRKKSEFARIYHSRSRVRFVKVMGCTACGWESGDPIENAHTGAQSGAGRKADYQSIIPLCRSCHDRFDGRTGPGRSAFLNQHTFSPGGRAVEVESAWQDWGE